jgi:gamma-glutamyltranspeptidase/glutathione hydrolase
MVVAAHPLAVDAGVAMLERGGSAVDAAIAVQLVLNLVEPSSSGLGGGAYFVHYEARSKSVSVIDGRETAPAGATPELFLDREGKPLSFNAARVGGRSVGVPGVPRLLEAAHARHGKLAWKALFEPAIALAERGFPLSPRQAHLAALEPGFADEPATRAYFFDAQGKPKPAGTIQRNPELAATLRAIAAHGADAFYTGEIARDIVDAVRGHRNAGSLSLDDMSGYRVRHLDAVCGRYRTWKLCGPPPSSSSGIAMVQIMGMLESRDLSQVRAGSTEAVHLKAEAERLAFADRARYVADDRFVDVPLAGLIDPGYIATRARLIRAEKAMGRATAGNPVGARGAYAPDTTDVDFGTSHLSVVDADGNAVSLTTSIESAFGSHIMVRGLLLNNQLTDFSFVPAGDSGPVANRVEPGKRPRSSMAPFVVLDAATGTLDMVLGSPGGSLIIGYVSKVLIGVLDWKLDVQAAIDLPNAGSRNGPTEIERGTELERIAPALKAIGHEVRAMDMTSGIHAIRRVGDGWDGGADPRREGVARGR